MTDTRKASLTLYASTNGDGPDGIRMECEFDGDFNPESNVDNIINYFANQLIEGSELLKNGPKPEPSRILVPGGV